MRNGQPVNWVHEYQQMRDDRERWREAAKALKHWLDKSYCWHCGVEPERNYDTTKACELYETAAKHGE